MVQTTQLLLGVVFITQKGGSTMKELTVDEIMFLMYYKNANSDAQKEAVRLLELGQQNHDEVSQS